jgi:prophage antirepressor-like protein
MEVTKVQFADQELEVKSLVDKTGLKWFLANPFARILGYSNAPNAINTHVSLINQKTLEDLQYEDIMTKPKINKSSKCINANGLKELVLNSKMPHAVEFRYWIVNVLFPSLKIDTEKEFTEWRKLPANQALLQEHLPIKTKGLVYVVTNSLYQQNDLYKIGYTYRMDERLDDLNNASAFDFTVEYTHPTEECRRLERLLHSKFSNKRVRREFFKLTTEDLDDLKQYCESRTN